MGKSAISMAIFNSYVSLPEGIDLIISFSVWAQHTFNTIVWVLPKVRATIDYADDMESRMLGTQLHHDSWVAMSSYYTFIKFGNRLYTSNVLVG